MTSIVDFEKLSEAAHDNENFCVVCMMVREDVNVEMSCCDDCAGGPIPKEKLH